jgi:hypothetical protein
MFDSGRQRHSKPSRAEISSQKRSVLSYCSATYSPIPRSPLKARFSSTFMPSADFVHSTCRPSKLGPASCASS